MNIPINDIYNQSTKRSDNDCIYKDENNVGTISFDDSGEIVYDVMNDGVNKTKPGVWYADQSYVSIIVDSDTTYGTYEIKNGFLTIITTEEESDGYYGNSTILNYSRK